MTVLVVIGQFCEFQAAPRGVIKPPLFGPDSSNKRNSPEPAVPRETKP
jgi:hypothetical protein